MELRNRLEFLDKDNFSQYDYSPIYETGGQANLNSNPRYKFRIQKSDDIMLLSDAYLHFRGRYVDAVSTANPLSQPVTMTNGGFSLFSEAELKFQGKVVSTYQNSDVAQQVMGLINNSDDYSRGLGQMEFWYPDTSDYTVQELNKGAADILTAMGAANASDVQATAGVLQVETGNTVADNNARIDILFNGVPLEFVKADGTRAYPYIATAVDPDEPVLLGNNIGGGTEIADQNIQIFYNDQLISIIDSAAAPTTFSDTFTYRNGTGLIVSAGNIAARNLRAILSNFVVNDGGLAKRLALTTRHGSGVSTDTVFEFWYPLRKLFPILSQYSIPLSGMQIDLDFNKHDRRVYTLASTALATSAFDLLVDDLTLWVPTISYKLPIKGQYYSLLADNVLTMDYIDYQVNESNVTGASTGGQVRIDVISYEIEKIYIIFQKSDRRSQDTTQNPRIFDNAGIKSLYLKLNATKFPHYEYDTSFSDGSDKDYMRVYHAYLKECGILSSPDCMPAVGYEQFRELYPIWCFDLTSNKRDIYVNSGAVSVDAVYTKTADNNNDYNMFSIIQYRNGIALDVVNGRVTTVRTA